MDLIFQVVVDLGLELASKEPRAILVQRVAAGGGLGAEDFVNGPRNPQEDHVAAVMQQGQLGVQGVGARWRLLWSSS